MRNFESSKNVAVNSTYWAENCCQEIYLWVKGNVARTNRSFLKWQEYSTMQHYNNNTATYNNISYKTSPTAEFQRWLYISQDNRNCDAVRPPWGVMMRELEVREKNGLLPDIIYEHPLKNKWHTHLGNRPFPGMESLEKFCSPSPHPEVDFDCPQFSPEKRVGIENIQWQESVGRCRYEHHQNGSCFPMHLPAWNNDISNWLSRGGWVG